MNCRMYGQLVVGPPGSGKSTYCKGMKEFLTSLGRKCAVVNMDPANEFLPYECEIDLRDLITVTDAMQRFQLGPNGGLVYCIEHLNENVDWLLEKLKQLQSDGYDYVLFDFPGQVELYTNHRDVKSIIHRLIAEDHRLVTVFLTDSHYCTDPGKFISVLITTLTAMIQLETPHINILSKVDLIEKYGTLPFNLEYFCEVLDLNHLLELMDEDPFTKKYRELTKALCGIVEDYGLVSFLPLHIENKEMMLRVLRESDKANGHSLRQSEEEAFANLVHRTDPSQHLHVQNVHEKYCKN